MIFLPYLVLYSPGVIIYVCFVPQPKHAGLIQIDRAIQAKEAHKHTQPLCGSCLYMSHNTTTIYIMHHYGRLSNRLTMFKLQYLIGVPMCDGAVSHKSHLYWWFLHSASKESLAQNSSDGHCYAIWYLGIESTALLCSAKCFQRGITWKDRHFKIGFLNWSSVR